VVPWSFWWHLLRFFVAEHVGEHAVWLGDSFIDLSFSYHHFASGSGGEDGSIGITAPDDNWQLVVVDPSFGPVYARLGCREPGVSQDELVFP
jgi:hypothetical protein